MEMTVMNPSEGSVNAHGPNPVYKQGGKEISLVSAPNLYGSEKLAPTNTPVHIQKNDFKPAVVAGDGASGITRVLMTVDNEDHALHFIKKLFKQELITKAQLKQGKMHRSYLKFGKMHTESERVSVELTTKSDRVSNLIEWINLHQPTQYDYPVPDMMAVAIKSGNEAYIQSIKTDIDLGKNVKMDEVEDATNVIDIQLQESATQLQNAIDHAK